jgi:protein ImuB
VSIDENARKLDLRVGHTLAFAKATVPELLTAPATERVDFDGLNKIALEFLRLYSPIISIPMNNNILLDVTGCTHLFGGEKELVDSILTWLTTRKICARVTIADTIGCATAFAVWSKKPVTIVPPRAQVQSMKRLPIASLRLGSNTVGALRRLGFNRVGDLYDTPRAPLVLRFGKAVVQRLDQALGTQAELIEPIEAPEVPSAKCSFTEPAANPEFIRQAIETLAEKLCKELEAKGFGARRLDLIYRRVDNSFQAIRVGIVSASRTEKHYMRLLQEHFDKVEYGFGIESLSLIASMTEPMGAKQTISDLGTTEQANLSDLVDILNNRLGKEHVYQISAVESDVPERSVKRVPPLSKKYLHKWPDSLLRPTRLLPYPEQIKGLALLPDDAPKQFLWREKQYRVKRADGPERIFGEWWKRSAEILAVRDYFLLEDYEGARFWVFRRGDGIDLSTGTHEWFLHGFFG